MALARFIGANAERLAGKIIFICQPAEEGSRGAYPILQSGVLHGVDTIFCGHIAPELEVGDVVAEPTKLLSTTKIDFEFTGRAAHAGAHPQAGRNARRPEHRSLARLDGGRGARRKRRRQP